MATDGDGGYIQSLQLLCQYAGDLVAITESEDELIKKLNRRKDGMQSKG